MKTSFSSLVSLMRLIGSAGNPWIKLPCESPTYLVVMGNSSEPPPLSHHHLFTSPQVEVWSCGIEPMCHGTLRVPVRGAPTTRVPFLEFVFLSSLFEEFFSAGLLSRLFCRTPCFHLAWTSSQSLINWLQREGSGEFYLEPINAPSHTSLISS